MLSSTTGTPSIKKRVVGQIDVNNTFAMDASIWDQPVVQFSQRRAEKSRLLDIEDDEVPQRPKKRARQALFYADSDDDDNLPGPSNTETVLQAPPPHDIDIEALFADVDDPDNEVSRPLPAILDEEELTRQAEARFRKNLIPHDILPSSSPTREQEEKSTRKKGHKDDEKKSRRRQLKLDENLVLSPTGFPQLIKMTKDFRIKGKGHEVRLRSPTASDVLILFRQQIWIDFYGYTNIGHIDCTQRPHSMIQSNALKNCVIHEG